MSEKYTGHNLNPESVGEISSRNKNRAEIKKNGLVIFKCMGLNLAKIMKTGD